MKNEAASSMKGSFVKKAEKKSINVWHRWLALSASAGS